MKRELQNPKFVEYVFKNGISVEDAYILVHLMSYQKCRFKLDEPCGGSQEQNF